MKRGKREVKRTGLGRRLLSVFLAVVMCTSMLQLTVFAEGTDAPATSNIMDGAFVLETNGSVVSNEGANTVTYPAEGFTLTKFATQPEGYAENEFEVTLQVVTRQTVTTDAAAIQLVIDTSSSMQYCSVCGQDRCNHRADNRMTAVQKILTETNGFLDSLVSANTGSIYVSVVSYGFDAETEIEWVDIKDKDNLKAVKDAITGLNAVDNGTNTQAGLMLARNRLGMDKVANASVKYTVLLTDGYANCVATDSNNQTKIALSGNKPMSAQATTQGTNGAKSMIEAVSKKSTYTTASINELLARRLPP